MHWAPPFEFHVVFRRAAVCSVIPLLLLAPKRSAQAQTSNTPATTNTPPAPQKRDAEVVSEDVSPTFKVRVNLVLVRVTVRDQKGNLIEDLQKEDFQLFDNGKPQAITSFALEDMGKATHVLATAS